jgi:hypothetical protein
MMSARIHNHKPTHEALMNASERIDELIAGIADWRGETLAYVRRIILEADGGIVEE